ncbi:hypothetical protein BDK89_0398 [Ilumatobacter fluminis]|uniref:Uncharacterized protein n=1 Tax=Ilumatobacter fluminis TaxID=467091 RepID=A0A4R7HVF3_9ACTN|nr:hypothetical protein [Ilumatobacter fluminis]TDT14840.1 hypothetical protein BDK89_0398 [Ilumatobacter fluminis]
MSEPNDPFETRLRRLVGDAADDAPTPPYVEEMLQMPRPTDDRHPARRRWIAGGTIGLVAAAVIALLVLPGNDDDAIQPVDTPAPTTTVESTGPTVPSSDTTVPTTEVVATSVPDDPTSTIPTAATDPTSTVPTAPLTVIAALDDNGDAVLVPTDADPFVVLDGPDPDQPAPEEGPGPNVVDSVALRPAGHTAFVGMCCEPIAGSILSGSPTDFGTESVAFGYAPAFSPDDRYLAIGVIQGPALTITDLTTGFDLALPEFAPEVGTYSPADTMWLDPTRVVALGTRLDDDGTPRWIAIPMVVNGQVVEVGEPLDVNEMLPAGENATPIEHPIVRFAGVVDDDHFAIHVPGETNAISVEFRPDGVISGSTAASGDPSGVGESARSIWYRPGNPVVWVGEDGSLHRGDETFSGSYQWARPTDAVSLESTGEPTQPPTTTPMGIAPESVVDVAQRSAFGWSFGDQVFVPALVDRLSADIGEPSFDSGWQSMPDVWACTGQAAYRTLWWGDFRMTIEGDGSDDATVSGWSVGDPDAAFAPLGNRPTSTEASGVGWSSEVGVGTARDRVLPAIPVDSGMIDEQPNRVTVNGVLPLTVLIDDDTVTGIGSGRNDCIDEMNPGL